MTAVGTVGPGWHPDPFDRTRLRWWDGTTWSARIARLEAGSDGISWHAAIGDLAPPTPRTVAPPVQSVEVPVEPAPPALKLAATEAWAPTRAGATLPEPERPMRAHPRRRRKVWAILAAAVVVLAAGAGVSTAMLSDDQRPTLEPTFAYRDTAAHFALRYPMEWRARDRDRTPGQGVRFLIGARDATPTEANTLTVRAQAADQALPALHLLANETTADVIAEHPNFRLASATSTRLAGAPAFRLELVDRTTAPATRIVQYVGRTTGGRLLYVTLTVREPRTQPSAEELRRFLASVTSL